MRVTDVSVDADITAPRVCALVLARAHAGMLTATHLRMQMESHSSPEHLQRGLKLSPFRSLFVRLFVHSLIHSFIHSLFKLHFRTRSVPALRLGPGVAEMNMTGP